MRTANTRLVVLLTAALLLAAAARTSAFERLCDPSFENCRTPLIDLIRNETVGLDVAFWFMEDSRYSVEIIRRWQAGVPVRVLMDTRANPSYPLNADRLRELKDAGVPMREKTTDGILHWKMMLFAGQDVVEFSGANYSSNAFVPAEPYVNYVDEIIYFSSDPDIVNSFRTRFDDVWTTTSGYATYANVTGPLLRHYPTYPIHPDLNFPPGASSQDFGARSVRFYDRETVAIASIMYRITDRRHTDALLRARARGVTVRLNTEPKQYRDPTRLWHAWNVDRLYMAGVEIRHRRHLGLNHEKLTLLHGQGLTILGSSNWTSPSANSQLEHNYFTSKPWIFQYARDHFDRKWFSDSDTEWFVPLPPDAPVYHAPVNGAQNQGHTVTLRWYAGPWAHKYDVYLGTDPSAMVRLTTFQ
jgi:phosphatidylserine/phosphatidylglycerophosphate/cardiolipin synthase-like enzyme